MVSLSPVSHKHVLDDQEVPALRPFFENIIDKKVNAVALTIFEKIVDFLCSYLYPAYYKRSEYRLNDLKLEAKEDEGEIEDDPKAKVIVKNVHRFMDGAPLYDYTHSQRVSIKTSKLFGLITKENLEEDRILVDGKPVYFTTNPKATVLFGKKFGTKEVVATDTQECSELVMIYERETSNNLKAWCVDTTQITKLQTMGGQLVLGEEEVFVAQEVAPFTAPPTLVFSFP